MGNTKEIHIQYDLRPTYYDEFHCIAQDCHDSCCNGWEVSFNKQDYFKLKKELQNTKLADLSETVAVRCKKGSSNENIYAKIRMCENGNCPFLAESGLCNLQVEAGVEALPTICQTFPRRTEYSFSGYCEKSLSLGCEAVLQLLWNLPEGIEFRADPLPQNEQGFLTSHDSTELVEQFQDIRSLCIDVLQNRSLPLHNRILLLGMRLQELSQKETDIAVWMQKTELLANHELLANAGQHEMQQGNGTQFFLSDQVNTLTTMANSGNNLKAMSESLLSWFSSKDVAVHQTDVQRFNEIRMRFIDRYQEQSYFFENLAVSLFFSQKYPYVTSREEVWKSFVSFCKIYSFLYFLSIMSTEVEFPPIIGGPNGQKKTFEPGSLESLFHAIVTGSRALLHNSERVTLLQKSFFRREFATLAHIASLLGF